MAAQNVTNVSDQTFQQEVLSASVPTLVDFWATWCGPCKAIAPAVESLATTFSGSLKVCKMDIDANQGTPQAYGIRSIPTLLIFHKGKVIDQIVGAVPKAKLEEKVRAAIAKAH
jgi:thioredoxin 1